MGYTNVWFQGSQSTIIGGWFSKTASPDEIINWFATNQVRWVLINPFRNGPVVPRREQYFSNGIAVDLAFQISTCVDTDGLMRNWNDMLGWIIICRYRNRLLNYSSTGMSVFVTNALILSIWRQVQITTINIPRQNIKDALQLRK